MRTPRAVVVMGVAGSGKSTVGAALATRLTARFIDADDLHPEANVTKMAAGTPLTDADRIPWLERVGGAVAAQVAHGRSAVVACSALRRPYRDQIRAAAAQDVAFIHLDASPALLAARLDARAAHFMPPTLLASQLATLEPLDPDESGTTVDISGSVQDAVESATTWLCGESPA